MSDVKGQTTAAGGGVRAAMGVGVGMGRRRGRALVVVSDPGSERDSPVDEVHYWHVPLQADMCVAEALAKADAHRVCACMCTFTRARARICAYGFVNLDLVFHCIAYGYFTCVHVPVNERVHVRPCV